ncbi:MAG: hypothetical protein R3B47_09275 [Bacteroidia bacterium]
MNQKKSTRGSNAGFAYEQNYIGKVEARIDPVEGFLAKFFNDFKLLSGALIINILALALTAYVFLVPVQSVDLFNGLVADFDMTLVWFWVSIILFSLVIWYSTVISLYLHDLKGLKLSYAFFRKYSEEDLGRLQENLINRLPFVFAALVFIIVALGFSKAGVADNRIGWGFLLTGTLLYAGLYMIRQRIAKMKNLGSMIDLERASWESFSSIDKWIVRLSTLAVVLALAGSLFISSMAIKPVQIPLMFRTTSLLCLYLSGQVMVFSVLWGITKLRLSRFSLGMTLLVIIPLFSVFNNNHQIRLAEQHLQEKVPIETDFKNWLAERMDTGYSEANRMPVFLISAEGGGIRSLKWTALVLDQLFEANPMMLRQTYALSGVSGGSVGMMFQQASMEKPEASRTRKLNAAISKDFLAPVTFGLLFPDMVQSVIPFPVHSWDRSRWLEDSWLRSFKNEFGSEVLNLSINDYWNQPGRELPNIFFNSTCTETGQKVLMSNLALSEAHFPNVFDLDGAIHAENRAQGIPLKTAASLSARFPVVTSAGLVRLPGKSVNVVDGGYHDNTGLETLLQIATMIMKTTDDSLLKRCEIHVIFIKNSSDISFAEVESRNFLVDGSAPLLTLLSNWNNRTPALLHQMNDLVYLFRKFGISIEFSRFELDREVFVDGEKQPRLRWQRQASHPSFGLVSFTSVLNAEISRQVEAIVDTTEFNMEKDRVARSNYETFQRLMKACGGSEAPAVRLKSKEELDTIYGKGIE